MMVIIFRNNTVFTHSPHKIMVELLILMTKRRSTRRLKPSKSQKILSRGKERIFQRSNAAPTARATKKRKKKKKEKKNKDPPR